MSAARVVAEKFDRKAHDAVNYRVSDQNLTVEAFSFMQENQQAENDQHRDRFVKLRRVQVQRRAVAQVDLEPVPAGKVDVREMENQQLRAAGRRGVRKVERPDARCGGRSTRCRPDRHRRGEGLDGTGDVRHDLPSAGRRRGRGIGDPTWTGDATVDGGVMPRQRSARGCHICRERSTSTRGHPVLTFNS